jgi:phage FluMu protein Com
MKCRICGKNLKVSIYNDLGQKSCPKCSVENRTEHIFYDEADFGFSDKRITKNNPKGIQSYCKNCRSKSW